MSLTDFKITYHDGATQEVTAAGSQPQGDWLVFTDGSGEVLRVHSAEVQSVRRDGVPDRQKRAPKTAAV